MNYPTTAEIKDAIRQLKADTYEWAQELADSLAEEYPDSDPKAVRRAGFHTRFGYILPGEPPEDVHANTAEWGGEVHSLSQLRDLVEDDYYGGIFWVEAQMYPTVTWVNPRSEDKRREGVDFGRVFFYPLEPATVSLWTSSDY